MNELPDLPVPMDLSVRGVDYLPLDVRTLRDSGLSLTATDAEFRAAVMLWCAAWHQIPAGTLPNDDKQLMILAGVRSARKWKAIKSGCMRGFTLSRLGVYYHYTLCTLALHLRNKRDKARVNAEYRWQKTQKNPQNGHADALRDSNAGAMLNSIVYDSINKPSAYEALPLDRLARILDKTRIVLETINPATRAKLAQALDRYGESEFTDAVVKASAANEYNGKPIANPAAWALARLANRAAESAEKRDRHAIPPGGREIAT